MFRQSALQTLRTAAPATSRSFSSSARRDFARLTLVGRLGSEPEVVSTSNGREVIRYSIATNHGSRDNQTTSWFKISSFVNDGVPQNHLLGLPKGTLMLVEGDAHMRTFEDGEGKKSSLLSVVQRKYEVLSRPSGQGEPNH